MNYPKSGNDALRVHLAENPEHVSVSRNEGGWAWDGCATCGLATPTSPIAAVIVKLRERARTGGWGEWTEVLEWAGVAPCPYTLQAPEAEKLHRALAEVGVRIDDGMPGPVRFRAPLVEAFRRGTIGLLVVEVAPLCAFCHAAPRIDGSPLCVEHDPIVTWVRVPEDEAGAWALIADLHVVEVSDAWSGKSCEGGDNAGRERRMIPGSPSHVRHYASKEVPS